MSSAKDKKEKTSGNFILIDYIPYKLSMIAERSSDILASQYKHLDLSRSQFRVIALVSFYPHISVSEVGRKTRLDKSRVTRAVDSMAKRKLIIRETNPEDKRSCLLVLTPKGHEIFLEISKLAMRIQRRFMNSLNKEELQHFNTMLIKFESAANQLEAEAKAGEFDR